jgi:hypothetical protein
MPAWTTADGHATHRLTPDQRAELRLRIDAAVRAVLYQQRFTHRFCPDCGEHLHKSEFPDGRGRVCFGCLALAESEGGGAL